MSRQRLAIADPWAATSLCALLALALLLPASGCGKYGRPRRVQKAEPAGSSFAPPHQEIVLP